MGDRRAVRVGKAFAKDYEISTRASVLAKFATPTLPPKPGLLAPFCPNDPTEEMFKRRDPLVNFVAARKRQ